MPVVSMMRIPGNPDDLLAKYNQHIKPVAERLAPKHGGLAHFVTRDGDDGLLVINVWEHEEGRHAMPEEPEMQAAREASAFPMPRFEAHEVLDMTVRQDAVR
jgi:hypothetical protein